ncbi:MAG: histidinol-phosphate transaminase [Eubacteriales bacterium]|nr:histidinol-phosphate transaminase [Eubacteriales bacterium]
MSRYFTKTLAALKPYVPGEQPRDMKYVKLNTNESPFPPSEAAMKYASEHLRSLNLYPDPESAGLIKALADTYGVASEEVIVSNGSDEILFFAFKAFCDNEHKAVFPDITYGCYTVFANANNVPYREIPLKEDLTIDTGDYAETGNTIVLANPNAPTGIALPLESIEELLKAHPDDIVIIDEAYIDFGGESCIPLIKAYDNLLVVQTFSKSRSMAGARLGYAIGNRELIRDLNTIRNSFNPYNINSMTYSAAIGTLMDREYTLNNCREIIRVREYTVSELVKMGFKVLDSKANFVFACSDRISGEELYRRLKEKGVLIRHFAKDRIDNYNRITIGTKEQMDILLDRIREML